MRISLFASGSALFILAIASCQPDSGSTGTPGTGGNASAGTTGSGGSGTAGTTGSGGSGTAGTTGSGGSDTAGTTGSGGSDTAGTTGTAGSSGGRGGTTGTGGTSTAGTTGTAGSSGGRGGTTGTGGTSTAGTTGTAGSSGGRGGTTGTGGTGGTTGTAGATGTGGTGGSLLSIVGAFDGFLFTAPCGDGGTGYDCLNTGCTNGSPKTVMMDFPVGGTAGVNYNMTMNIKGVTEAKNYSGCTRSVTGALVFNANGGDLWCEGGTIPDSTYNTYEINVFSAATGGTAIGQYRLNARDGTSEAHQSWPLNETKTIRVVGGGRIQWRVYDSNCRQIMNCGAGTGSSTCMAPVTLSLAGATPAAPTSFMQPFKGTGATANAYGQWVFIDVTNVVAAP